MTIVQIVSCLVHQAIVWETIDESMNVEFISFADHMHTQHVPRFVVALNSHSFHRLLCLISVALKAPLDHGPRGLPSAGRPI